MNLQRAYYLLCGFYSLLIVIGATALLMGAGTLLNLLQVGVGALAVIGLWGHTLEEGYLNPRIWRPLTYLLAAGIVIQLMAIFTLSLSATALTWVLTGAIFSVLPMLVLYQYGERDQALWASQEEREGGRTLAALLAAQPELVAEKRVADRQATVRLQRSGSEYRAKVVRARGDEEECFEERFTCPATLAFFIEKFTCLSVHDFAEKYAAEQHPIGEASPA